MIYDVNRLASVTEPVGGYAGAEYGGVVWPESGVKYIERDGVTGKTELRFWPSLVPSTVEGITTYSVSLTDGWVSEVIPGENTPPAPAGAFHKPFNLLWGDDAVSPNLPTDRRTFDMSIGQQLSVVVYQDEEGAFGGDLAPAGGPVEVVVEDEESSGTAVSVHYNPPGGDVITGDSGEIHYKIAVLRDADADHDQPWLEIFLGGSNINVLRDLPMLENTAESAATGIGRVFKEYDPTTNQYKFRPISKGAGQLQVNESADDIEVRGNDKTFDVIFMQETDASPTEIARVSFEDGLGMEDENVTVTIPKAGTTDGDDFNLENWPCSMVLGSPPSAPNWVIYYRKGLAYLTDPEDSVTTKRIQFDGFSCESPDGP